MSGREVSWKIDPHTETKHKILSNYLKRWFPILGSKFQKVLYVDGYAGPGEYCKESPGGRETVNGSPIIALKTARDHLLKRKFQCSELVFHFIEKEEQRLRYLKQKISEIGDLPSNFKVKLYPYTFESVLEKVLSEIEAQGKRLAPSFVFIDPFGPIDVPSSHLLERLAQQPQSEILINLDYLDISRWFLPNPQKHGYLDKIYGSGIWRQALEISDPRCKEEFLKRRYQEMLQGVGWRGVVQPFRMVNRHNQTQYYLFFGTSHPRGMLAMKEAMRSASPGGDFQYSDLTDPQQLRLFGKEEFDKQRSQELAHQIYHSHQGQIVHYETLLQNDVAWHPVCIETHLTKALRSLENDSPPKIVEVKRSDDKSKGSFKGCNIAFAP